MIGHRSWSRASRGVSEHPHGNVALLHEYTAARTKDIGHLAYCLGIPRWVTLARKCRGLCVLACWLTAAVSLNLRGDDAELVRTASTVRVSRPLKETASCAPG